MMQTGYIKTKKTARICYSGNPEQSLDHLFIVLHGYGHLASYFLKKFESIESPKRLIVAPEGLHRYYLNGVNGRVGASWMTKEERENDIEDYCEYLDNVYTHFKEQFVFPPKKVSVLGFSQGAATAARWVCKSHHKIDELILWSAVFPEDMDPNKDQIVLQSKKCFVLWGDKDEYLPSDKQYEFESLYKKWNKPPEIIRFKGGHEIPPETLQDLIIKRA